MSEKVMLITGGGGFIGSHLCDHFIRRGFRVICVDNFITGSPQNVEHLKSHPLFEISRQDVSQYIDFREKLDYVLHFASPASPIDYLNHPIPTLKVGALGTHNALGLALKKQAVFLLASTSEVYGDPLVHPQNENYWGNVNPVGPRGVYDEAKRFAEAMTMAYHNAHQVDAKIIRIFNTYGPRMRARDGRAVPEFINQALCGEPITVFGDGKQTRSFCYVDDLVRGIDHVLFSDLNEPVNLGNPNEMTILECAKLIVEMTASKSEIVFRELPKDDPKVRQPDITKAHKVFGWEPKIPFREGLKNVIEYFRSRLHETNRS